MECGTQSDGEALVCLSSPGCFLYQATIFNVLHSNKHCVFQFFFLHILCTYYNQLIQLYSYMFEIRLLLFLSCRHVPIPAEASWLSGQLAVGVTVGIRPMRELNVRVGPKQNPDTNPFIYTWQFWIVC